LYVRLKSLLFETVTNFQFLVLPSV